MIEKLTYALIQFKKALNLNFSKKTHLRQKSLIMSSTWLKLLRQHQIIAVIRTSQLSIGQQMAQAVAAGGINIIEITWNSADAPQLIAQLRRELPHCIIGTGTLLNQQQLEQAIAVGVQFLFTPHIDPALIALAVAADIPIVPGALSPTEIVTAWASGASAVKVFPIQAVGGASYIKALQGPLGQIPLIPTGGVTMENAQELLAAGAIAVGLSGELFPKSLIMKNDWSAIANRVKAFKAQLNK